MSARRRLPAGRHRMPVRHRDFRGELLLVGVGVVTLVVAAKASPADTAFNPGTIKAAVLTQPAAQPAPKRIPPILGANGLTPRTAALAHWLQATFPDIPEIGGWRPPDGYHEHDRGLALDVMVDSVLGDRVADAALAQPGVRFVIWKQQIRYPNGVRRWMQDRGNPTANHMNHVHIGVVS